MAEENKNRKNIWKISHGALNAKEAKDALEKQVVTIGFVNQEEDHYNQRAEFTKKAQTGDFFYLSNVKCEDGKHSVQLLGQFKGKEEPSEIKEGWVQRPYKLIASAIDYNYTVEGPRIGWAPNYNRTVFKVEPKDHQLFEERILTRNFNLKLEDLYKYENDDFNEEKSSAKVLKWFKPLVQALRDLGGSARPKEVFAKIIENEHLSHEEISETTKKNNANMFETEVRYVRQYLTNAGYMDDSEPGVWALTERGQNEEMDEKTAQYIYKNFRKKDNLDDQFETVGEDNTEILISDANDMNMKSEELGKILGEMYNLADADKELSVVAAVHTFGIKYGKIISENQYKCADIVSSSGIKDSYETELSKAVRTYDCLASNKFGISIVEKDSDQFQKNLSGNEEENQIRENESGHVTIDDSTYQTFKNKDNDIKNYSHNRIFFGAPGTGKSYMLNQEKDALLENSGEYERVTFHPDYSYANFVGTYKPVNDENGEIKYEYVPGPFMRTFVKAMKNAIEVQDKHAEPKPYLLIIEEINRADVAAVFGDVFQLLDRKDNVSEYPIETSEDMRKYLSKELNVNLSDCEKIKIPDNMFIWATMNSADQGVFPMDTAFKRRWDFEYIGIDANEADLEGKTVNLADLDIEWNALRKAINDFLAQEGINEDKQLGPYFISRKIVVPDDGKKEIDPEEFIPAFKDKVIMYLFEDAARQHREIFNYRKINNTDTATPKSLRYSQICNYFVDNGINIFCDEIKNKYKDYTTQNEN